MRLASDAVDKLHDFDEIYENPENNDVEQSAIYAEVSFSCVTRTRFGVILTPICDIYWQKADYVKVAGLIPADRILEQWLLKSKKLTPEQIVGGQPLKSQAKVETIWKDFVKWYVNNREIRYHFLPSYRDIFPHSFVDFQLVESFRLPDIQGYTKVAVLKPPWGAEVLGRYSSYCGRIGTRDYSEELLGQIMGAICRLAAPQQQYICKTVVSLSELFHCVTIPEHNEANLTLSAPMSVQVEKPVNSYHKSISCIWS